MADGGFEGIEDAFGAVAALDGAGDGAGGEAEASAVAGEGLPAAELEEVEEEVGGGGWVEAKLPVGRGVAEGRGGGGGGGFAGGAAQELAGPGGEVVGESAGQAEAGDVGGPALGVVEGVEEGVALVGEGGAQPAGGGGGGGDGGGMEVDQPSGVEEGQLEGEGAVAAEGVAARRVVEVVPGAEADEMGGSGGGSVGEANGCIIMEVAEGEGDGEGAEQARGGGDGVARQGEIGGSEEVVGHHVRSGCRFCRMIVKKNGKGNRTEKGQSWGMARITRNGAKRGERGRKGEGKEVGRGLMKDEKHGFAELGPARLAKWLNVGGKGFIMAVSLWGVGQPKRDWAGNERQADALPTVDK